MVWHGLAGQEHGVKVELQEDCMEQRPTWVGSGGGGVGNSIGQSYLAACPAYSQMCSLGIAGPSRVTRARW